MAIFAEMPHLAAGISAWLVAGLILGWLAGKLFGVNGYGRIFVCFAALAGALAGGFMFRVIKETDASASNVALFLNNFAVAVLGACVFIALGRALGAGQRG